MQQIKNIISICFLFNIGAVCFCQNYETFHLNKVKFTIDTLKNHSYIKWFDSTVSVNPNDPIISALNGNPPFDLYRNPWSPSSIYHWYFYLPYSDTLIISMYNFAGKINSEPQKIFLQKGKYILKSDSKYADEISVSSMYSLSISFCDSTYKRNFIVLK